MNLTHITYRSLLKGGLLTVILGLVLVWGGLVIIHPRHVSQVVYIIINACSVGVVWVLLSFLIQKFSFYKVSVLISLLIVGTIADRIVKFPFNPITITFVVFFWMGSVYLIAPHFFNKYKYAIIGVYGIVLCYFFFFRFSPDYIDYHHNIFLQLLIIPIPAFICLWIYEQWKWLKSLQADKVKSELALLKSQINPHFFFNTLNNLYGLAVEKSDDAPKMILKLSEIMRYTIYDSKEDFVALTDEISYLEDYIDLCRLRYPQQVNVSFVREVPVNIRIAPLLLIVPLENAFKHGVRSITNGAYINIEIKATSNSLEYLVSNSYETMGAQTSGIGLANMKKRLELLYPNKHKLDIIDANNTYTVKLSLTL